MKVTVEFDLEDAQDASRYHLLINASTIKFFIYTWEKQLHAWYKNTEKAPTLEEIRNKYYELKGQNVFMWDDI